MSDKMYEDDVEFIGVIEIDSEAIVIGDPTKKISKGVVIRDFGGNGIYPVFIIKDSEGNVVGATINFDVDTTSEDDEIDFDAN